ncbi:MAG: hemerythrin domain-containing protein [Polyangiaceae bacterium]
MKSTKKSDVPQLVSATELLKTQHDKIKELFRRIERAKDDSAKRAIFEEIASNLVAHDGIEREVFYPACEAELGMSDLLGEALVEHGVVEFGLFMAEQGLGESDFDFRSTVLKELILHHVEEEERKLLPKVEKAFGRERLETLGRELQDCFSAKIGEDYRLALYGNLRQVLEGALKTRPSKERKRPRVSAVASDGRKKGAPSRRSRAAATERRGRDSSPSSERKTSKKTAGSTRGRRQGPSNGRSSRKPTTASAKGRGSESARRARGQTRQGSSGTGGRAAQEAKGTRGGAALGARRTAERRA